MADDLVLDAERIVLGSMLLDPSVIDAITARLRSADFADIRHGSIFAAITANHAGGAETGAVGIAITLGAVKELQRVGGAGYLHDLVAAVPTTANAGWYATVVATAAEARAAKADGIRLVQVADSGDLDRITAERARLVEQWAGRGTTASSWCPVDLATILDGTNVPPMPTVGRRDDGAGLFYPGRLSTVASESEAGKTWLVGLAAVTELGRGEAVIFLDFEDDAAGVVGRLLAMGAKPVELSTRFAYIRPDDPLTAGSARGDLAQALGDLRPTLAILDGVTEAMALHGFELKDNTDIARFGKLLPRWIADQGPAAVALDHVVKDRDARGRYAIGGVHKLNGVNGAALVLENRAPFGIGLTGRSTVYVAKDRPGQLRRHALPASEGLHWLADLVIKSHDATFVEASLAVPNGDGGAFRPTVLMARVSEALHRAPSPLTKAELEERVRGKRVADVRAALAVLIDEGFVAVAKGPNNSKLHTLVTPFGEES